MKHVIVVCCSDGRQDAERELRHIVEADVAHPWRACGALMYFARDFKYMQENGVSMAVEHEAFKDLAMLTELMRASEIVIAGHAPCAKYRLGYGDQLRSLQLAHRNISDMNLGVPVRLFMNDEERRWREHTF